MIIISLFDEVEFDDRGSGGYLDDETSIRREKHFLGSVVLPFQVKKGAAYFTTRSTGQAVLLRSRGCFYIDTRCESAG